MKIKMEEINQEVIKTEEIEEEKIEKEDVESSFRASLSRFSYPSSPPSARRRPKRPSPDSNPNPPTSASLTVSVAVAQPTPTVRQDESNNDESIGSGAVQALRRSPRKRKGETRPCLDTGDGVGGGGIRPSKKMKKIRRGNPRAPEVDLSHFGALPEHLAEDLDGTSLPPNPTHACSILVYIKRLSVPTFERFLCCTSLPTSSGIPAQCSFAESSTWIPLIMFLHLYANWSTQNTIKPGAHVCNRRTPLRKWY